MSSKNQFHQSLMNGFMATVLGLSLSLPAAAQPPAFAPVRFQPQDLNDRALADQSDALATQETEDDGDDDGADLLDLPIEQLATQQARAPALEQVVSTVTRNPSTVGKSPAAVYVVTNEMIRRSGATNIPQALRLVPGLNVARIDANKWAISSRGLNNRFANKLLVLMDGRAVYTPLFSGVYWEAQDTVLQDIERIEVIRGPGATAWGANAVNGVINIVTKNASDTQGLLATSGGGDQDRAVNALRYGGTIGENFHYRIYGKHYDHNRSFSATRPHDDWRTGRFGIRADWNPGGCDCDKITLLAEYFIGRFGNSLTNAIPTPPFTEFVAEDIDHSGGHFLTRWERQLSEDSSATVQFYFDRTNRKDLQVDQFTDIIDFDFQHSFMMADIHGMTWGARYRNVDANVGTVNPFTFQLVPAHRSTDLVSAWVQDEVPLIGDEVRLVAGSKFEINDFTGFEWQPSARLLWSPDDRQAIWGSVSRAVRTPSLIEDGLRFRTLAQPPATFSRIVGNPQILSEDLVAFEFGYRMQVTESFSWDIATFYNDYEDLVTFRLTGPPSGVPVDIPLTYDNAADAESYGFELSSQWEVTECWQLSGWYSFMRLNSHNSFNAGLEEDRSPRNQAFLMSSLDLGRGVEWDVMGRYIDILRNVNANAYISLDSRLGWRPNEEWEFSVVGQNLLERYHVEFAPTLVLTTPTEVPRGVYAQAIWRR